MKFYCHSSMPIESLAKARFTGEPEFSDLSFYRFFNYRIFRSSESKASVVCLKIIASSIRKIALLI